MKINRLWRMINQDGESITQVMNLVYTKIIRTTFYDNEGVVICTAMVEVQKLGSLENLSEEKEWK